MKIVKNRYLNALYNLMLLSAIIHMVVLIIYTTITKNINYLNFFNILQLKLIFPINDQGIISFIISGFVALILYLVFLGLNQKEKK